MRGRVRAWAEVRERLRALLFRSREERELAKELELHIELETAQNLRKGMSPEEARRQAMLVFGGVERFKEEVRDARGVRGLDDFASDLRHGLRSLRRAPAFTATAVLILALGIGMATAMFTVFRAVVLQELPVRDPDRIVTLWTFRDPTVELAIDITQVRALRRESRTLLEVAAFNHYGTFTLPLAEGDRPLTLSATTVTANFFDMLGARPVLGRLLRPDDRDATSRVTVISYETWQQQFGGDPGVVGRRLTTTSDQLSYTIVGVAPPGLDYPGGVDYWIPVGGGDSPGVGFDVVARLAPGATPEAARSARRALGDRDAPASPCPAITRRVAGGARGRPAGRRRPPRAEPSAPQAARARLRPGAPLDRPALGFGRGVRLAAGGPRDAGRALRTPPRDPLCPASPSCSWP